MMTNVAYSLKGTAIAFFFWEYIRKQTGSPQMVAQPAETAKSCQIKEQVYGIIESSATQNVDEVSGCQFSWLHCSQV